MRSTSTCGMGRASSDTPTRRRISVRTSPDRRLSTVSRASAPAPSSPSPCATASSDTTPSLTSAIGPHLNVALATDTIETAWRNKALVISGIVLALCGLTIFLSLLYGRDLRRRAALQAELAELSCTDVLTGLPNRRRFEEVAERVWATARRTTQTLRPARRRCRPLQTLQRPLRTFGRGTKSSRGSPRA